MSDLEREVSLVARIRMYLHDLDGTYTVPEVAAKLRPEIPDDEWGAWAEAHAMAAFVRVVGDVKRSTDSRLRRSVFQGALERLAEGDITSLGFFRLSYEVDEEGTQMRLGDMTGGDCRAAARIKGLEGKALLAQQAFLEAIAKKDPAKPRSEVYTEEQLAKMYGRWAA